jgi:hypothetical protein
VILDPRQLSQAQRDALFDGFVECEAAIGEGQAKELTHTLE